MSEAKAAVGRRVLVVEDESMIRMLLDGMLSDIGYTMTAEAGALDEAIRAGEARRVRCRDPRRQSER